MTKQLSSNSHGMIEFQGKLYFDDRLFVVYLCKGTVKVGDDGVIVTTIYHEQAPTEHIWCVVTYRNCDRYPLYSAISFYKEEDAIGYIDQIEPQTPLISLNGVPMSPILPHEEYILWKKHNNYKDYLWKNLYTPGSSNQCENIFQTKDQFKGIH